jgi:hypothetical protein
VGKSDLHYIDATNIMFSMTIAKYKSNQSVVYSCKYHVVGCPKCKRSLLNDLVQKELKAIIENISHVRKYDD